MQIAVAGAGLALVLLVVSAVALSDRPAVTAASPTPTLAATPRPTTAPPSPTASPSPSPTPTTAPTARPTTRTPEPTISYVAGSRLIPYYFEIRQLFTALPPAPVIDPDLWEDAPENASFNGLDAQGQPKFAVRHDFVMDKPTAAHEAGHAYQKVMEKLHPGQDVMAMYWSFRGFPGTWQQALAASASQPSYSAKWIGNPVESWAEAFRAAVTLEAKERTLDYGKTIDPVAMRAFFRSLAPAG
jgi:hypothetical protein